MNNHTPRTDSAAVAVEGDAEGSTHEERAGSLDYRRYVRADFARQLERELAEATEYADETHARHESLIEQIAKLKDENAALSEELREQCVLNGKGGSRETKLLAELDKLRNENARLNGQTRWQCTCGGTDCDGQRENAALREELNCQKICASDLAEKVLELRKDKERLMAREKALDELTAESQRLGLY